MTLSLRTRTRKLVSSLIALSTCITGNCSVPMHFHYVFGANGEVAKHMKASAFFNSALQLELAEATVRGNTNRMPALIQAGADVNLSGTNGMRPLFWTLINRSFKGFRALLDFGADPNALVQNSSPPAESALTLAAALNEPEFLVELLRRGADPNLTVASTRQTAIFTAAFYGNTNNISILLKHGAKIDWKTLGGNTAMHTSVLGDSYGTALFLYRHGADPLATNNLGHSPMDTLRQFGGRFFLKRSERTEYKELIQELMKTGLIKPDVLP